MSFDFTPCPPKRAISIILPAKDVVDQLCAECGALYEAGESASGLVFALLVPGHVSKRDWEYFHERMADSLTVYGLRQQIRSRPR